MPSVTQLVHTWNKGNNHALDQLISLCYQKLHKSAKKAIGYYPGTNSLQATELINELYYHFRKQGICQCTDSEHFFALAAYKLRQILQERYRCKNSLKRKPPVNLQTSSAIKAQEKPSLLETLIVRQLLEKMESIDEQATRIVELRTFWEFNIREVANIQGISEPTVKRRWRWAKSWMLKELEST